MSEKKCETGCRLFDGGERRHEKNCAFYPESFTEMYDKSQAENKRLCEALKIYANERNWTEIDPVPRPIVWTKSEYGYAVARKALENE